MAEVLTGQYLEIPEMTLRDTVTFVGQGLFSGEECKIELHPAKPGTGIAIFFGHTAVPCTAENIVEEGSHATTIGSEEIKLRSVEHLLAALYYCGVSNCEVVVLKGGEVPGDGSGACGEYVSEIMRVGLVKQESSIWCMSPASRRRFRWNGSTAVIEPNASSSPSSTLEIQVNISFPLPIGVQVVKWRSSPDEILDQSGAFEFTNARSFLRRDLNYRWPGDVDHWTYLHDSIRGLPASKSELRLMAFEGEGWLVAPRYDYEAAWHKLVDLVGDLSLVGGRLCGKIEVYKPGHAFNHRLVHWLRGAYRSEMPITARLD